MSVLRILSGSPRALRSAVLATLLVASCAGPEASGERRRQPTGADAPNDSDDDDDGFSDGSETETTDGGGTPSRQSSPTARPNRDAGSAGDASGANDTPSTGDAGDAEDEAPGDADIPAEPVDTGDCPAGAICRDEAPSKSTSEAGKFEVKTYDIARSTEHGGGTVYYPGNAEKFSGAVYCPPLTGSRVMYAGWGRFLASHGIAMVAMDTRSTQDSVQSRGGQLAAMVKQFRGEATRSGSAISGKLDATRIGTMGWSMGGGATWIAAARDPSLKSSISMAGHNATGGGAANSRGTKVPSMQLAGQTDTGILGGMGQSQGVYGIIPNETPKILFVIRGVGHMSWGGPKSATGSAGELTLAFQKTYLDGDTRWKKFLSKPENASEWRSNITP